VPHDWTDKLARKMQASKEVWGKIFGTISTEVRAKRPSRAAVGAARANIP
jgi:cytochrome c-type protein NapC